MKRDRKSKLLLFFIVALILYAIASSYNRFIINKDYLIEYEAPCNSEVENCFKLACEDTEECAPETYKIVIKKASDLRTQCGETVIGCKLSEVCLENDVDCQIIYCNSDQYEQCVGPDFNN